jgi:GAF domain-containing protein
MVSDHAAALARVRALVEAEPAIAGAPIGTVGWLQRLCSVAIWDLPAWGVAVSLMTDDTSQGLAAASDEMSKAVEELQFVLGEGPCLDALAMRRPVLVPDLSGEPETWWPGYAPAARAHGVRAVFAFPMQVGGARLGVLDVYRNEVGSLSVVELTEALTFAQVATAAVLDGQERSAEGGVVDGLDGAFESRYELHQAQGMIMVQLGISLADAMVRLRAYAYANERSLSLVAADIVARRLTLEKDES